jgi:hypothetical protein
MLTWYPITGLFPWLVSNPLKGILSYDIAADVDRALAASEE